LPTDIDEHGAQALGGILAEAQEVDVPRRPIWLCFPHDEQGRTLEQERA